MIGGLREQSGHAQRVGLLFVDALHQVDFRRISVELARDGHRGRCRQLNRELGFVLGPRLLDGHLVDRHALERIARGRASRWCVGARIRRSR